MDAETGVHSYRLAKPVVSELDRRLFASGCGGVRRCGLLEKWVMWPRRTGVRQISCIPAAYRVSRGL